MPCPRRPLSKRLPSAAAVASTAARGSCRVERPGVAQRAGLGRAGARLEYNAAAVAPGRSGQFRGRSGLSWLSVGRAGRAGRGAGRPGAVRAHLETPRQQFEAASAGTASRRPRPQRGTTLRYAVLRDSAASNGAGRGWNPPPPL